MPVLIAFTFTIARVSALPDALATYRERGFLRRLSTTPLRPRGCSARSSSTSARDGAATACVILALARIAFGVPLPRQPLGFVLAVVLAAPRCSRSAC